MVEEEKPVEKEEEPVEEVPSSIEDIEMAQEAGKLLIDPETYLKHGIHIGLTYRTGNMQKFIYKVRSDRLSIFNLNILDERIRLAAKMLAKYDKKDVLVVGSRAYARRPVRKFSELAGLEYIAGRFRPGTFTNPHEDNFKEPKIVLVADPIADKQAVRESAKVGISVIGLCDSNALTRNIELIIPCNNKGKHSLALLFWLLTKQYLIERGEIKEGEEPKETIEDFISQIRPTKKIEAVLKSKTKKPRKKR